jgi:magnesium transporter
MNLTLAMASHKMNEVMQVLTIISAIFIPPTLIAGIYGMNFQHMPELAWRHGYFYVLMVIACITAVQLGMFWWKDWLVLPNFMSKLTPPFLEERKAQRRRRSP